MKISTTGVDVGVESGNGEYAVIGGAPEGPGTETKDELLLVWLGTDVLTAALPVKSACECMGWELSVKSGRIDAVWPLSSGAFVANSGVGSLSSVYKYDE